MADKLEFTKSQMEVIEERRDEILVSASAGSGKTTVMIERIVSLLNEGEDLSRMAVCTFTKAAAADMRLKLYKRLCSLSADGNDKAALQLKGLAAAQISTLHSFCQQLIKSYFYAIETDPDFSVLSETDATALLNTCIEREIEKRLKTENTDFAVVYEVMLKNRKTYELCENIKKLYEFASVQPDFERWISNAESVALGHDECKKILKDELEGDFLSMRKASEDLLNRTYRAGFKRNYDAAAQLFEAVQARVNATVSASGRVPPQKDFVELNEEFKVLKDSYNKLFKRLDDIENSADPNLALPYTKVLLDMTRCVKAEYESQKMKNGYKDYSDLEHDALKILQNDEVKKQIDAKFLYLFVDEYQDINPIQESIISHFAAKKFYVGDVKQSIYSFRMCTPQIFAAKKLRIKESNNKNAAAIELNSNFRSVPSILQFCNEVFSSVMTSGFGGCDYKNEAAFEIKTENENIKEVVDSFELNDLERETAATIIAGNTKKPVKLFLVSGKGEEETAALSIYSVKEHSIDEESKELMDAEIQLIIDHIFDLISPVQSGGNGAEFKDIAILLRSTSGVYAKKLKTALNKSGIPAFLQEKKSAEGNEAVTVLIEYLKLINNREDDIALAASLRSPLGGFSDDELAQIRESYKGNGRYFFNAVQSALESDIANDIINSKLKAFFHRLDRFTFDAYYKNASQLLGDICAEFDYFKYVFALKDGSVKAKELAAFLSFAEESIYKSSVGEFVSAISSEMPKIELSVSESDAVRIMTVHASKGLEFPFVIIGNMAKKYNRTDLSGTLLLDSELGAALKVWDLKEHEKLNSSLYLAVRSRILKRLNEEEARILYVALTRAKKGLALFASIENIDNLKSMPQIKASSFFDLTAEQFIKYGEKFDISECVFDCGPPPVHIHNKKANLNLVREIEKHIGFESESESSLPFKATVTKLAKIETDNADEELKFEGIFNPQGLEKGTLYHLLMEKVDFNFSDEESEWQRLSKLIGQSIDLINRTVFFKACKTLKQIVNGRKFYREMPFVCRLDAKDMFGGNEVKGDVLVQGVIDLLIVDSDSIIIADYKSGEITSKLLPAYKKQLELYAIAAQKITAKKVKQKLIYSFHSASVIEI